jgi:hypothetical protein
MDQYKLFILQRYGSRFPLNIDEYWKHINNINNKYNHDGIMLNKILEVNTYIGGTYDYTTKSLNFHTIYKKYISLNKQINSEIKRNIRFCYIVTFLNWDKKKEEITSSHMTLICHENKKVYLYNSGFTNETTQKKIDSLIQKYYKKNNIKINFVKTENWCKKCIQGDTPLCGRYVLDFYNLLMKYPKKSITELIYERRCAPFL